VRRGRRRARHPPISHSRSPAGPEPRPPSIDDRKPRRECVTLPAHPRPPARTNETGLRETPPVAATVTEAAHKCDFFATSFQVRAQVLYVWGRPPRDATLPAAHIGSGRGSPGFERPCSVALQSFARSRQVTSRCRFQSGECLGPLCWRPNRRPGNHHLTARPIAVRLHQQSGSQPHVRSRGLWMRAARLRLTGRPSSERRIGQRTAGCPGRA
jgi:hypothetical protein